jgi:hypothetical protein
MGLGMGLGMGSGMGLSMGLGMGLGMGLSMGLGSTPTLQSLLQAVVAPVSDLGVRLSMKQTRQDLGAYFPFVGAVRGHDERRPAHHDAPCRGPRELLELSIQQI